MNRYTTEYRKHGAAYAAEVDALDLEHAQAICDERGFGEVVQGVLFAVVVGGSQEKAGAMCQAFADNDDEPPLAGEFGREATEPNWNP